ncbi:MAG: chemotaxis response regulator protein-glutamate methylesterase [Pseudomonadales bacterium]|nr:chemotaxis response regulator protein-glutamate methylesterase [Pseudomonadales bacterium]
MPIKILIVDDSQFFRKRLCELFEGHPGICVVATAVNGEEALAKVEAHRPDLITMDYEMPVMDGVTAVRRIMGRYPTPILMISALTYEGASVTLDALEAGALDFVAKLGNDGSNPFLEKKLLCEQVLQLVSSSKAGPVHTFPTSQKIKVDIKQTPCELVVIGASTGGPVAVQELLSKLPGDFPLPIVVAIHMPENFTQAYANRLASSCNIEVKEAEDQDQLIPGRALIAPGGKLLKIGKKYMGFVTLERKKKEFNFSPSVDYLFESAANSYSQKVLAIVLTGMGSDGRIGARKLHQKKATIWAQDEESSLIYGMPSVIAKDKLASQVLNIDEMVLGLKSLNG